MVLDEDQVVPSTHFSYDQLCHMDSALPIIYLISLGPFSHTSLNLGRCPCPSCQGHWHSSEMYLFSDTCLASSPPQASGTVASRKGSQNTGTSRNGLRGQGRVRLLTTSNPPGSCTQWVLARQGLHGAGMEWGSSKMLTGPPQHLSISLSPVSETFRTMGQTHRAGQDGPALQP